MPVYSLAISRPHLKVVSTNGPSLSLRRQRNERQGGGRWARDRRIPLFAGRFAPLRAVRLPPLVPERRANERDARNPNGLFTRPDCGRPAGRAKAMTFARPFDYATERALADRICRLPLCPRRHECGLRARSVGLFPNEGDRFPFLRPVSLSAPFCSFGSNFEERSKRQQSLLLRVHSPCSTRFFPFHLLFFCSAIHKTR